MLLKSPGLSVRSRTQNEVFLFKNGIGKDKDSGGEGVASLALLVTSDESLAHFPGIWKRPGVRQG